MSEEAVYFSQHFKVTPGRLTRHGAFNISLVTDLPLFVDPFLLFNSRKKVYRQLHDEIIRYLGFLRDKSASKGLDPDLMQAWYRFPEVKQTWLGFSVTGNRGHGLGGEFARALHKNLHQLFPEFGKEQVTKGSHLEKLCLVRDGVGRDNISDFTTNLIHGFLAEYTQAFARRYIDPTQRKRFPIRKARFRYDTETWETVEYDLPFHLGDYVLLTPKDILTKDDTWINKADLIDEFERLPDAIPNAELRAQINNYFRKQLAIYEEPTRKEVHEAALATVLQYPAVIDYYIRNKEETGDRAQSVSAAKVADSELLYVRQAGHLRELLAKAGFYASVGDVHDEAHGRVAFFKDFIENKGGHRFFYTKGQPIPREVDLQLMYRLTWYGTTSDVTREANDGRGPVDFKISRGAKNKSLVEFKLASNSQLKRNLKKQVEIYKKASDASHAIKVIVFFSEDEEARVRTTLRELEIANNPDVVLIDARNDNKPSGSKA